MTSTEKNELWNNFKCPVCGSRLSHSMGTEYNYISSSDAISDRDLTRKASGLRLTRN
jgi:hypothetical protein